MSHVAPRLKAVLAASNRWSDHVHLEATPSTNDEAVARARAGAPSGLVVTTDHQTAGRGRLGRRWSDLPAERSLPVSVLVDAPAAATLVPHATGLAVVEVARVGARLKWPNDVLVGGRKIAGILVEAVGDRLVIGTGINLDWRGVDRDGPWTSIAEVTGAAPDRWNVLGDLLSALDRRLTQLERDPTLVREAYRRACETLGREVRAQLPSGVVVGVAEDIDDRGALLIRSGERALVVTAGDVHHLRGLD